MLRKAILALAAVAFGAALIATDASAAPMHRGFGNFRGGGHNFGIRPGLRQGFGARQGFGFRQGFHARPFVRGFYGPQLYAYDNGCWQPRMVLTPWGWQWRRVWVCY